MFCSQVQIKKEEPEDDKIDIKVKHKSSPHHYSSSFSCTANDIKPVIIKHEIKKEEYDSDCDCNDCRVAQGKVLKIKANDDLPNTQIQTDKHDDDCGCNDCVQNRQVGDQVSDQANQGENDQSVDLTDQPIDDDASRSSTPDWMPSIFSEDDDDEESDDDDETEIDKETSQDDDDNDPDFSVNDEEEIQNEEEEDDDTQQESDCSLGENYTLVPAKLKGNESNGKSNISINAIYKCLVEGCIKAFKNSRNLKRHNKVHTRERPFACKQCKRKFSTKGEVTRHVQNVHLQTKQWRCSWPSCKHRGGYWFNMVTHVKGVHLQKSDDKSRDPGEYIKKCEGTSIEEEEKSDTEVEDEVGDHDHNDDSKRKTRFITIHLNCLDCAKTFKKRKDLKRHQLKAHRIQKNRCLVKGCLASFENKDKFQKHISAKHRNCEMWSCQECDHQLKTYQDLVNHFTMKHQKGRFVCAYNSCTVEKDTVNEIVTHHISVHQPAKYRCSRCKKLFKQRRELLNHERQHTGDRPFGCTLCDKRYTGKSELNKHIRAKHQSRKPYSCKWDHCQHEYGDIGNIRKHVRVHLERAGDKRDPKMFIEKHYEPVTIAAVAGSKETSKNRSQETSNKKKTKKKKSTR